MKTLKESLINRNSLENDIYNLKDYKTVHKYWREIFKNPTYKNHIVVWRYDDIQFGEPDGYTYVCFITLFKNDPSTEYIIKALNSDSKLDKCYDWTERLIEIDKADSTRSRSNKISGDVFLVGVNVYKDFVWIENSKSAFHNYIEQDSDLVAVYPIKGNYNNIYKDICNIMSKYADVNKYPNLKNYH